MATGIQKPGPGEDPSCDVVDHLLSRIVKRRVQPCDQCLHLLWRHAGFFTDHLVFIVRIGRVPFRIDQIHYNFPFRVGQRRMASLKVLSDRNHYLQQVWIVNEDLLRSRCLATFLDYEVVTLPLFGGHLIDWDLGVTTERTEI